MMYNSSDLQRHIGKFYGKYSGEVVNNEDEEKRGQIMVRISSIFGEESNSAVTARPCLPYGHFYIPPVGAKVWVEFEAGDLAHAIWVGTWYPVNSTPEQAAVNPPNHRLIHTPSGHVIELSDQEGEEKIIIKHKGNAFISIDKDGSVLMSNPNGSHIYLNAPGEEATFVEQHGNIIAMNKNGTLIVNNAGTTLEIKDKGLRVISGDTVQISAQNVLLDSASVSLSNNAQFAAIVGDLFATMYDAHMHTTPMGPSGPPMPPNLAALRPDVLSKAVKLK